MRNKKIKTKVLCPYEIGDKLQFANGKTMEITDIITKTSLKRNKTTFILELDGWYKLDTSLHDVEIPEKPQKH